MKYYSIDLTVILGTNGGRDRAVEALIDSICSIGELEPGTEIGSLYYTVPKLQDEDRNEF